MTAVLDRPAAAVPRVAASPWTGAGTLLRFALRRDRVRIGVWALAVGAITAFSVVAALDAYPDEAARRARATLSDSPATVVIAGPLFGEGDPGLGAVVANELVMFLLVVVAVMSVLVVIRHTRADEEAGRTELLRALPTGRFAPAASAVLAVAVTNLAVAVVVAAALIGNDLEVAGSLAVAASSVATGLVFGAVAAVTAQLTSHARAASGMALGVLGVAFLLRAVGDVMEPASGSWLSWASPLAWGQQVRHYADLRWWPLLLSVVVAAALFALAGVLSTRRDLGAGLRRERPGPADARPGLLSAHGLARRLLRGSFAAWTTGVGVIAIVFGGLAYAMEDLAEESPEVVDWIGGNADELVTSFAAFMLAFVVTGIAAFGVSAVLRLRAEEQAGRAELVVASGSARSGWLGGWLAVAAGQVVIALLVGGLGLGIGVASATGDADWIGELLVASLVYLPAVLATAALAAALIGLAPRLASIAWVLVGWVALVTTLGEILDLPEAARDVSPVHLTPLVPVEDVVAGPLVGLSVAAVVLVVIGLTGIRRRDVIGQ